MNKASRLVDWQEDGAGISKHGHIRDNHAMRRDGGAHTIQQGDLFAETRSRLLANFGSNLAQLSL